MGGGELDLNQCSQVRDLGSLVWLKQLRKLDLSCVQVSDLGPLAHLAHLTTLNLSGCPWVSDLGPLAGLHGRRRAGPEPVLAGTGPWLFGLAETAQEAGSELRPGE